MHLPKPVEGPVRDAIDRWLGTTCLAIHLRVVGAAGLLALATELHDHKGLGANLLWALVSCAWLALFPRVRHLERVYGTRVLAGAAFAFALGVPLAFAAVLTGFALSGDARTFGSPGAFWAVRAICAALAFGGWWAAFRVLGFRRKFARLVRKSI